MPTAKEAKAAVHYGQGSVEKRCGLCEMWRPPASCSAVAGDISPSGVCDLWKRAKSQKDRASARFGKG